ncbi:murein transglycosylase domain-containing protein [Salicola sp. Rm-C-2C1-2]|uniref:murein transglycosylase domain-containing protein n=1 Tax=Salicola sp. Rm-C-2C1-2 TaxID=3141321 RepID=UPI0032E4F146
MKYASFLFSVVLLSASASQAQEAFDELESATSEFEQQESEGSASGFKEYKQRQQQGFQSYKQKVRKEFAAYKKAHDNAHDDYRKRITEVWHDPLVSSQKQWVKYEDDYRLRTLIDFDAEKVRISWPADSAKGLDRNGFEAKLSELLQLTTKQAFEQDEVAQKVEAFGKENLSTFETGQVDKKPVIETFLLGSESGNPGVRKKLREHFMEKAKRVEEAEHGQDVASWEFPLETPDELAPSKSVAPDSKGAVAESESPEATPVTEDGAIWHTRVINSKMVETLPSRVHGFINAINDKNAEFDLSAELILALIETESAFNPMAKSHIPAYGLMQIVPKSAGMDATEKVFGKARVLSPSYLYNSGNNIEIGAAYFNILYYRYFESVEDPLSRLYCAISAYNTGPGNVAKALTRGGGMRLKPAIQEANAMAPDEVYDRLMNHLPYDETVHYLRKVTDRLAKYKSRFAGADN